MTRYLLYYCLTMLLACFTNTVSGQIWFTGMADPILNETFGDGTSISGPALPAGVTDYTYTASSCPNQGQYTLARNNNACSAGSGWKNYARDHTFQFNESKLEGYALLCDVDKPGNNIVYQATINNLCNPTEYLFSCYYEALGQCTAGEGANLLFRIETLSGQEIMTSWPGASNMMLFYPSLKSSHGFYFRLPPGETAVVVKILNGFGSIGGCGSKVLLDDIQVRPNMSQRLNVRFSNTTDIVRSVCFDQNATIEMTGSLTSGDFTNPAYQWQQSFDLGATWSDIPGATGFTYTQTFNTPDTIKYRIRGSEAALIGNPNCSMVSNQIKVDVNGPPTNIKPTSNSPVCSGSTLRLSLEGAAQAEWFGPNGYYDNIVSPSIYQTELADSGMYYVQIRTVGGCTGRDSTRVVIIGTDVRVTPSDTAFCKGNRVRMVATPGLVHYSWTPANMVSDSISNVTFAVPEVTTTYTVRATDSYGCTATATSRIRLRNTVATKADFYSPDYLCRPIDTATFINQSTGVIASYNWDFRNGQTSIEKDPPQQNYVINTTIQNYIVTLNIVDTAGCRDSAFHQLKVADNCYIAVPSAFTPNGDGKNDFLFPINAYKAKNLTFRVYNRTGELIFQTHDWTRKWDGTHKGITLTTAVFVWTLEYTDEGQRKIFKRGTTTLIR